METGALLAISDRSMEKMYRDSDEFRSVLLASAMRHTITRYMSRMMDVIVSKKLRKRSFGESRITADKPVAETPRTPTNTIAALVYGLISSTDGSPLVYSWRRVSALKPRAHRPSPNEPRLN
jgi:hypothetical protein